MADDEEIVTFRLAPADRAAIQRLVARGEFRNRSDFLRYAVKSTLRAHEAALPDLDLPDIDLPAPASARKGQPRARKGVNL